MMKEVHGGTLTGFISLPVELVVKLITAREVISRNRLGIVPTQGASVKGCF